MNIKLNFNEQFNSIDVIYPINYSDRLDGLEDTISCEFYLNDDLLPYYHKHQKIIIDVLDDENNILKEFRMCATDLNRELCSTYDKNSAYTYRYTLTACEPTVLINENIRTDIAITPYLYKDNPYKTLLDATRKIISCHNLNSRNEPVYFVYNRWDFSKDITENNIDYIPFDGCNFYISGFAEGGNISKHIYVPQTYTDTTWNVRLPNVNWNNEKIVSFPYNYSTTQTVTKTETISIPDLEPITTVTTEDVTFTISINYDTTNNIISYTITDVPLGWKDINFTVDYKPNNSLNLYSLLSSVPCPSLTYIDLSTYSQLDDIFSRVGIVPYLDFNDNKQCYLTYYQLQGSFDNNDYSTIETFSNEETAKLNDYTSNSASVKLKNISCDTETITFPSQFASLLKENNYNNSISYNLNEPFNLFSNGEYTSNNIRYKELTMLCPNTYDQSSKAIQDTNQYYLELPTNIENIQYIYQIVPTSNSSTQVTLKKLDSNKLVEYNMWQNLPASQQKLYAYFVRGENKIRQFISLLEDVMDLSGDWAWSNGNCYDAVRKGRFICVYKPIIDLSYTYYRYNNINDKTTKNINLPYKAISDKQISNTIAYEYEKQVSNKISYKLVTGDINEVTNHYAGQRVYYKNRKLNKSDFIGSNPYTGEGVFETLNDLNSSYNPASPNIFSTNITWNSWAKVGTENDYKIYVINFNNKCWELYVGETCVITKMDVVINKNSIEISYELNTNIAQNSVTTGYSDNVRVSDNLSTETVVTREVNLYKTFLLNATSSYSSYNTYNNNPSFVCPNNQNLYLYNTNNFFMNGVDNLLLASGLANMNCFDCSQAYALDDTNKLNHLNCIFAYENVLFDNLQDYLIDIDNFQSIGTYNVAYSYFNDLQSKRLVFSKQDNEYIISNLVTQTDSFGTVTIPFFIEEGFTKEELDNLISEQWYIEYSLTSPDYVELLYHKGSSVERLTYWLLDTASYPTYYATISISMNSLENIYYLGIDRLTSHSSPYFIHSNNLSKMVFNCNNEVSLGNYTEGYNGKKFYKSKPLYYKMSNKFSSLYGIQGKDCNYYWDTENPPEYHPDSHDLDLTKFEDLIKKYGCCDLRIDLRERLSINIQYLTIPNNYNKFYGDNYIFLYLLQHSLNPDIYSPEQKYICNILEINNNIQWMDNIIDKQPQNIKTGSIIFKRIPKNVTMSEYLLTQTSYSTYCTANGYLMPYGWYDAEYGYQRTYSISIEASESLSDGSDEYNYVLINKKENGDEEPLMIIDTEGCEFPYNKINISYFLI